MNLPLTFAARYFVSKKSSNAVNIISWVSVLGMMVGALGLVLVLSVFNGFQQLVISLYNSFDAPLVVSPKTGKTFIPDSVAIVQLLHMKGVAAFSKVVEENALLTYGDQQYIATVKGVDSNYSRITGMDSAMYSGNFLLSNGQQEFAVIGAGIEQSLGVNYDDPFGYLTVFIPRKNVSAIIDPQDAFASDEIKPIGSFAIQAEFDGKYIFVPIDFVQRLEDDARSVSAIEIATQQNANAGEVEVRVQQLFGSNFYVRNRLEQNQTLYKVMKTEKWAVYAILVFILIVAAFNIIGSLSMLVIEKKKDISILKAMGADQKIIRRIFLFEGLLLSFTGCAAGFILSVAIILLQQKFQLIKIGGGSFVIDAYPVEMKLRDFVLVGATVIIIGIIAAWFPSQRASKSAIEPVKN